MITKLKYNLRSKNVCRFSPFIRRWSSTLRLIEHFLDIFTCKKGFLTIMLRKQLSKTPEETRKTTERENTDDLEVQDESPLRRTLGIICAMSSCIFFAFSSLLVKLLREIPPQEVVFFRNMVQVIFVLPPLIYNKIPIVGNTKHLPFLCVRGIAGTLALCCQFYAFQHMALADTYIHTYVY